MKRFLAGSTVFGILLSAALLARLVPHDPAEVVTAPGLRVTIEGRDPWTNLRLNNDPSTFRFAIVSDRTGAPRKGIFEKAIDRLNWLQPEFVVCVGDLVQGYADSAGPARQQWEELRGMIGRLEMPFFLTPGNHDLGNRLMGKLWQQQFGRRFYHFVYKEVLFLLLNTEDATGGTERYFSQDQLDYVRKVLEKESEVRWTFVLMHQPLWTYKGLEKNGWLEVEKALEGRNYTVFAGHRHHYRRFIRNGQHYYMLATTGGRSQLRGPSHGEFDHIVWVTMKQDGPVLANLMLDGIYPENIPQVKE
jgi:3',5'-cyclic AMP phosphodiesterase CpdA